MKKIDLPAFDYHDNLTVPLLAAVEAKHVESIEHHETDRDLITVTFHKAADANTFLKLIDRPETETVEAPVNEDDTTA